MENKTLVGVLLAIIIVLLGGMGYMYISQRSEDINKPVALATPSPTKNQPTMPPTGVFEPTVSQPPKSVTVKVYHFNRTLFDKAGSTVYWAAVNRSTTRPDVATYVVEELIKGPTSTEIAQGFDRTFGSGEFVTLSGTSNCGGKDFSISIVSGTATVRFCKATSLSGDNSGYIVSGEIEAMLKQFSTIKKVRILNQAGACFNDLRGDTDPAECVY